MGHEGSARLMAPGPHLSSCLAFLSHRCSGAVLHCAELQSISLISKDSAAKGLGVAGVGAGGDEDGESLSFSPVMK